MGLALPLSGLCPRYHMLIARAYSPQFYGGPDLGLRQAITARAFSPPAVWADAGAHR